VHQHILDFAKKHRGRITGRVIDVGSYEVNGGLRSVLPITLGVDMAPGPGVDQVCNVGDLISTFGAESFDSVCSADALEHMEDWDSALTNMWTILKTGGVFLITMANPKKGFHGYPSDYHRMDMDTFKRVFAGNQLHGEFFGGPSMGVCVSKQTPSLDLNIRPLPVKR
jgi:2-polyprenyl-3-methyl-5-hydroxy-6-metoxy-1,4-benzoquinol methylase